jgi:hypothetical protein
VFTVAVALLSVTPVTATFVEVTVIAHVALKLPSDVVTVIVELPAAIPDTTPLELTVAADVLLLDHVTVWFVALEGTIVSESCTVPPTAIEAVDVFSVTPVTGITGFDVTVTAHVWENPPSTVVTVIIALPAYTPVTRPLDVTVATAVLLLDHVTV